MSVPKAFEMVIGGEVIRISFGRSGQKTDPWTVFVDGEEFALASRVSQNEWVVSLGRDGNAGRFYRGRTCQPAVMDCVRTEFRLAAAEADEN